MAGGKITRIVGGTFTQECETLTFYHDNFTINAGDKIELTTDGEMTFGEPDIAPSGIYFIKGWWTDKNDKPITNALVEDHIKFHIQTRNIPKGSEISFKVYDYDGILPNNHISLEKFYPTEIISVDENGKAVIEWTLGERAAQLIRRESDAKIELFVRCTYKQEVVDLADTETTWLNVKMILAKQKLVLVRASAVHPLPEMFDTETGDILYVARQNIQSTRKTVNKIQELSTPNYKPNQAEKLADRIVVRKLEQGTMVMTSGKVTTTRRLYTYHVSDLDNNFSQQVKMGVNFRGTKGLNQYEAIADNTSSVKLLKTVGQLMRLTSSLFDVASMLTQAANNEKVSLPLIPFFITMEVDRVLDQFHEYDRQVFYNNMRAAVSKGLEATKDFFEYNKTNEEYKMGYNFVRITEKTMLNLLEGKIKELPYTEEGGREVNYISGLSYATYDSIADRNCGMVVQSIDEQEEDKYGRKITVHYIHALFLPELIKE